MRQAVGCRVAKDAFGGWLYLEWRGFRAEEEVTQGEFIGISDTTCLILEHTVVIRVPMDHISYASLRIHSNNYGAFFIWTALGAISSISNGPFLLITMPAWLIGGGIATSNEEKSGSFTKDYPDALWWRKAANYSRFPQGIPKEVELSKLKSKLVSSD